MDGTAAQAAPSRPDRLPTSDEIDRISELVDGIRRGCSSSEQLYQERGSVPANGQDLGFYAEKVVAHHLRGCLWAQLEPKQMRRYIHGVAATTADRGVDIVVNEGVGEELRLTLVQVKWYAENSRCPGEAVAKLVNIALACKDCLGLPELPRMKLVYRKGAKISETYPNAEKIIWDPWDPAEIEEPVVAAACSGSGADVPDDTYAAAAASALDLIQSDVLARIRARRESGETHHRVQMPTGTGKSRVAFGLAKEILERGSPRPALILAPRVEIVRQLVELGRAKDLAVRVVGNDGKWPTASNGEIVVAGNRIAELRSGDRGVDVSLLVVDEAHYRLAHGHLKTKVRCEQRLDLSACSFEGGADIVVPWARAAGQPCVSPRGTSYPESESCVCDVLFHFATFGRPPDYAMIVDYLEANHRSYSSVLACFQEVDSAIAFAETYRGRFPTRAGTVSAFVGVGDSEFTDRQNLEDFRSGAVRALCVVGKVEMGVDIPRCDTVLFVEPWNSCSRTLQLLGRGCRLHGTKPGFFKALVCVSDEEALHGRLEQFVKAVQGVQPDFFQNPRCLIDRAEAIWGDAHTDPGIPIDVLPGACKRLAKVEECFRGAVLRVFDRLGKLADPSYEYSVLKAMLAPKRFTFYEDYRAWWSGLEGTEKARWPEDPSRAYSSLGFQWCDLFGAAPLNLAEYRQTLGHAIEEVCDQIDFDDFGGPGKELYDYLRSGTAAGQNLPPNPLLYAEIKNWREAFTLR